MSATIIEFPQQNPQSFRMPDQLGAHTKVSRRSEERRLILAAISKNRPLEGQQSALVAGRLTILLADAKAEVKIRDIAADVWPNVPNPSKRLDKVTLLKGGSWHEGEERKKRLAKRPKNYAGVAKAAAQRLGRDVEDTLLDLFRGTSVERAMQDFPLDPELHEGWFGLADSLVAMSEAISRRADLRGHLKRLVSFPGRYDLATGQIASAGQPLLAHGLKLANEFEVVDEYPPIPSVPLCQHLLVPRFKRDLVVTSTTGEHTLTAGVAVWREIRLAIGPGDLTDIPRALLEVRTRVDLDMDGEPIGLDWPWRYLDGEEEVEVDLGDGKRVQAKINFGPYKGSSRVPLEGQGRGYKGATLQPEHCYVVWYPVSPENCARLLEGGITKEWTETRTFYELDPSVPTALPYGSVGAAIEAEALTNPEGLEADLAAQAMHVVEIVKEHADAHLAGVDRLRKAAWIRWESQ